MFSTFASLVVSRIVVALLCLIVWWLYYVNARLAYRLPRGSRKLLLQLSLVLGATMIVVAQVKFMERLVPQDAYGNHFFVFTIVECGGALIVLLWTLVRERSRAQGSSR